LFTSLSSSRTVDVKSCFLRLLPEEADGITAATAGKGDDDDDDGNGPNDTDFLADLRSSFFCLQNPTRTHLQ
jgi:hypothetical protein